MLDLHPRLELPSELRTPIPKPTSPRLCVVLKRVPELELVLRMMSGVAAAINAGKDDRLFWKNDMTAVQLIVPVTHTLLSMPRWDNSIVERVRLACLIQLSALKRKFGLIAADMSPLQEKLILQLNQQESSIDHWELELWVLITLSLERRLDKSILARIEELIAAVGINQSQAKELYKEILFIDILDLNPP